MKKLLLLVCCGIVSFACSDDDEKVKDTIYNHSQTLRSQAEVDEFASHGYTAVGGNFTITGDDITDLSGLSTITEVGGLIIFDTSLESLNGLENITRVNHGYLEIARNDLLANLEQLTNLVYVDDDLRVTNNKLLTTLHGLQNVAAFESIQIEGNDQLLNLEALHNTTTVVSLQIIYNNSLTSLEGLENLTGAQYVTIRDNKALTDITALSAMNSIGSLSVSDNRSLTSLHGLEGITSLESLSVEFNFILPSLNGLHNLKSLKTLRIWGNPGLTTLQHLSGITSVVSSSSSGDNFYIRDNDVLTSLAGLENISAFNGRVEVSDNASLSNLCALQPVLNGILNSPPKITGNLYNPSPEDIASGTNCSMD